MAETTQLVMAGKRMPVPRLFKRLLQVALAVAVTAAVFFVVIAGNGFLVGGRTTFRAGFNAWLVFIQRPDILATMVLTAFVTVLLVYWQRDKERRTGGPGRPSL
jgi:membrane protease YdiL (CAAX protease family)